MWQCQPVFALGVRGSGGSSNCSKLGTYVREKREGISASMTAIL